MALLKPCEMSDLSPHSGAKADIDSVRTPPSRPRHRGRPRQMMPVERTGAFTLACLAALLVVALAMGFLS